MLVRAEFGEDREREWIDTSIVVIVVLIPSVFFSMYFPLVLRYSIMMAVANPCRNRTVLFFFSSLIIVILLRSFVIVGYPRIQPGKHTF
jgi:hypothetical protein